MTSSLREHIKLAVSKLDNRHDLHLNVLRSTPKRTSTLFPHTNGPRWIQEEFLVTLASHMEEDEALRPASTSSSATEAAAAKRPKVLVAAISAYLYSHQSTSVLYISKVDSSGYAPAPLPYTRTLVSAFIGYFLLPFHAREKLVVTLFARSQTRYLFPNSGADLPGGEKSSKVVLGGLRLCQWWKGVYEDVARTATALADTSSSTNPSISLYYLLPGYSAEEAVGMLGPSRKPLPTSLSWVYASPFRDSLFDSTSTSPSLATIIPSLPDDPKTRFMDELALAAESDDMSNRDPKSSPKRKTAKEKDKEEDIEGRKRSHAALGKVGLGEFWERMGFRQEMSSGDVTGFFALATSTTATDDSAPADPPRSTSTSVITTSCEEPSSAAADNVDEPVLSPAVVTRLLDALLNCDFGTPAAGIVSSDTWLSSLENIVKSEIGESGWTASCATIPAKSGLPDAPQKRDRSEAPVTMLQPRKKKRP